MHEATFLQTVIKMQYMTVISERREASEVGRPSPQCSAWRQFCKKGKWLSEEALQIAVKRKEAKAKEKRKDISI